MTNLYEILGVSKDVSPDELRKAYRALAKKYHPDLRPGDKEAEDRFKEIGAAYDLLSDPEKRKRYDAGEIDDSGAEKADRRFYRDYADGGDGARYYWHSSGDGDGRSGFAAEDVFADLFGRTGGGRQGGFRMRGADATYALSCAFLDAVNGGRQRITLPDGKSLDVTIPPGTRDGQSLRLKGQGRPGMGGGPAGDAYIEIHVLPHRLFRRDGDDIHLELPVTLAEAVLGAKIRVPTVDGPVDLSVPAGSNSGSRLRLRGKGVARPGGGRGDQFVTLKISLPEKPDDDLKAFVDGWAKTHPYDVRGDMEAA